MKSQVQMRWNSSTQTWHDCDFITPDEVDVQNASYGWRKYRVVR